MGTIKLNAPVKWPAERLTLTAGVEEEGCFSKERGWRTPYISTADHLQFRGAPGSFPGCRYPVYRQTGRRIPASLRLFIFLFHLIHLIKPIGVLINMPFGQLKKTGINTPD